MRDPALQSAASAPTPPTPPPGLWHPLRIPTFRNLLMANVVSDVGTFMQSVGAAWLMLSFGVGPMFVALTQTASSLPFFLLALPAGAIGDICNRRRLILYTEFWMLSVAVVLAAVTVVGEMSPWLLLLLTFALAAGDAVEAPTWRAIFPELVPKADLAPASALNGIEFNFARAVGPGLAGLIIAWFGVGTAFVLNACSFLGVIIVIARWRRPDKPYQEPPETLGGATMAAIRYVRYSPPVRRLLLRMGSVMFFASALLALLPTVAHAASGTPGGYGLLLGLFGAGAIVGALLMQPARARISVDDLVSIGAGVLGVAIVATGLLRGLAALSVVMLVAGAAWIVFISLLSALGQALAPDWVRARVLAVYMLVMQGSMAAGSAVWGVVAQRSSLRLALIAAGVGTMTTLLLRAIARLPEPPAELGTWQHWRIPVVMPELEPDVDEGPVLVTVEYIVEPQDEAAFVLAIHEFERLRRRDGATAWGVFYDRETPGHYLETFLVDSWAEHLRQHARLTLADRDLEARVSRYGHSTIARHFIYARPQRLEE
jgi:MFS family permease